MLKVYGDMDLDLLLSLQCRAIIRSSMIAIPKQGVINLHNAPLPLLRGCDPFAWAIHDGLMKMGISLHQVPDEGIDAGPVFAQKYWDIEDTTTAWDLYDASLGFGEELLAESLLPILNGEIESVPQDEKLVTYHPMGQFRYDLLKADFMQVAATLSASMRAMTFPAFQVPYFEINDTKIGIHKCRQGEMYGKLGQRGDVLAIDEETGALTVGCKYGSIDLLSLEIEKGTLLTGAEAAKELGIEVGHNLNDA
eukprot:TRINITY_DN4614_c0_g1_i3.p1 TRINITY_DN4614_c0_g1~~TRINITY_DN4614_c0_g1_i3.p1  ORF type:complete len:251 (+),score=80.85 TRINITY_DN4614_c0_g1_i3:500-1252(+)